MPTSNNPYDLINALEKRYDELSLQANSDITATDITAADEIDDNDREFDDEVIAYSDYLIENYIITEDDIQTLIDLDMFTQEALTKLLKKRTGYDDIFKYIEDMGEDEE